MQIDLQILLGLNCNFSCGHCLNNSGPGNYSSDFSQEDHEILKSEIATNIPIKTIAFSGGEPLLYLEQIESIIKSISTNFPQRQIQYSITTNGSLLKNYFERIKALNITRCVISFDIFHNEFQSIERFEETIHISRSLFEETCINLVIEDDSDIELVKNIAVKLDVKIQISRPVKSGRYDKSENKQEGLNFKKLSCPNIQADKKLKISYYPNRGFSICCGPIVFSSSKFDEYFVFSSIREVLESCVYKTLLKTSETYIKDSFATSCKSCTEIFKNKGVLTHFSKIISKNNWNNYLDFNEVEQSDLEELNKLFQPKIVYSLPRGGARQSEYFQNSKLEESMKKFRVVESNRLSTEEVREVSDFTKDVFYNAHSEHYFISDLKRFYLDQEYFFSLPINSIRHFDSKNGLVASFVIGKIDPHPKFKEPVWHVGFWGISPRVTDKNHRMWIKSSWSDAIFELNKSGRVVSLVDFFNLPAKKMAECFGLKKLGYRLDPRT